MERPHDNSYWVIEGRLLAGEHPGRAGHLLGRRRIEELLDSGFDYFLDLTEAHELEPYDHLVLPRGALHVRHAIEDMSVPQTPQQMMAILTALDAALAAERCVYLHCLGGVGRTGMVVGCHLVRRGLSGTDALAQIAQWWATVEKRAYFPASPQTAEQVAYVLGWHAHESGGSR